MIATAFQSGYMVFACGRLCTPERSEQLTDVTRLHVFGLI